MLIALVISEPDKPRGRGLKLTPPPIKLLSQKDNLPILQPKNLTDILSELEKSKPDLFVVAGYGQILPKEILAIPKYGALNIHPSLLPKYRGPSPIQTVILKGERETGITIIKMDEKLDHGPIVFQKSISLKPPETTLSLSEKLANLSAKLLPEVISKYIKGELKPTPQKESGATYTQLIKKEDGKINWSKEVTQIEREIRAYCPWPGSYTFWQQKTKNKNQKSQKLIKIKKASILHPHIGCSQNQNPGYVFLTSSKKLAVNCGQGSLEIKRLQLEGKKEMAASEFLKGYSKIIGSVLK